MTPDPTLLDTDDRMEGSLLSRRRVLRLLGLTGSGLALGAGTGLESASAADLPGCVVRPARTEGPYFKDERLTRSDIRSDSKTGTVRPGVPLTLTFKVLRVSTAGCAPLAGIVIDLWQCDAQGVYSDIGGERTRGQDYLRGAQTTDAKGVATFRTVYPGWYPSRTVHIHFKARQVVGGQVRSSFTSQLFFDDAVSDQVMKLPAYARPGARSTRNANDNIYGNGGHQLELSLKGSPQAGFTSTFELGMNLK